MKTLYLDLSMGAAGDMLAAALLELTDDPQLTLEEIRNLGLPQVTIRAEASVKCGIQGTHLSVVTAEGEEDEHLHSHSHEHAHGHTHPHGDVLHRIGHQIEHLRISEKVKADILGVYTLLAQAESKVHGVPIEEIHFHEVGTLDALADITMVCWLMERLAPNRIVASAIHVGSGSVHCAHGILPVPAPATAELLKDIPVYGGSIQGELCTPTGAALLKYFVHEFAPMPCMKLKKTGYGMGKKDFPAANCVRAMLGETEDNSDSVYELSCNLDDMTGEEIGFAVTRLLEEGALDVYTIPIGMKKNRPGTMLCVLASSDRKVDLIQAMFKCTTTLGIREALLNRSVLQRSVETVETPCGPVRVKYAHGQGIERSKAEYEDLAKIAREQNISLAEAEKLLPN